MANADVAVDWQVSTTDTFSTLVASGSVTARYADAHSVHVVAGGLAPGRRVLLPLPRAGPHLPGRAHPHRARGRHRRPGPGDGLRLVRALRVGLLHRLPAHGRGPPRPDPAPGRLHLRGRRRHRRGPRARRRARSSSLADYRRRYAQYKTDPDLQAAHADRAVAGGAGRPRGGEQLRRHGPRRQQPGADRRAVDRPADRGLPRLLREHAAAAERRRRRGNSIPLYRRVRWGTLATFHMLDTRQFRDDQACGDGWKVCADADLATRSMTGAAQEAWLLDGLAQHLGTWDILGQQVFFARQFDATGAANMDAWDGYRALAVAHPAGLGRPGGAQPGRAHRRRARGLGQRPQGRLRQPGSATIGTELVCTSITSGGNGTATTTIPNAATNPHLQVLLQPARLRAHHDQPGADRGPTSARSRRSPSTARPPPPCESFVIHDGQPGLRAMS